MTYMQAMQQARRMYSDGGWSIHGIRRYLLERGVDGMPNLSHQTVHAWVDPEWAERRRKAVRECVRRHDRARAPDRTTFTVLDAEARARLRAIIGNDWLDDNEVARTLLLLRNEDRLSVRALSAVARRLFGIELTRSEWQRWLDQEKQENGTLPGLERLRSSATAR